MDKEYFDVLWRSLMRGGFADKSDLELAKDVFSQSNSEEEFIKKYTYDYFSGLQWYERQTISSYVYKYFKDKKLKLDSDLLYLMIDCVTHQQRFYPPNMITINNILEIAEKKYYNNQNIFNNDRGNIRN
jgi:hypothetical protein